MKPAIYSFFIFFTLATLFTTILQCNASTVSLHSNSSNKKTAFANISIELETYSDFKVYSNETTIFFVNTLEEPIELLTVYNNPIVNTRLGSYKSGNHTINFYSNNKIITTTALFKFPAIVNSGFTDKELELIILLVVVIAGGYYLVKKNQY